ncbi:MAG: (d)CMP kinase [Oscillospiraceae bacterium]|nr:(d)CMP kinase [Oscillospiraceae bacterium]
MAARKADIVVIGGGPAGYTAAIFAAKNGAGVLLADKAKRPLMKLRISGKGRCNLTNNCTDAEFFDNIFRGSRFLRSAESRFGPQDIMEFMEELGVPLKTERGRRVFPVSDRADDVAQALIDEAQRCGVKVIKEEVKSIEVTDGRVTGVITSSGKTECGAAVLATGGRSYPATGSTGDGYRIAAELGHTVSRTYPALVPLTCAEQWCAEAEGLSLRNVRLTCRKKKKVLFSEQGEMLFTSEGISGPLVLTMSSMIAGEDIAELETRIDLKPSLDRETLDKRLLRDMQEMSNRAFKNSLGELLPKSLIPVIVRLSGIDPDKKVNGITSAERGRLLELLKNLPLTVTGTGGWNEAIVTAGGITTKEVDPRTMASKLIRGLYIAGEVLDADGATGGYNLTIAFSTGHAAGTAAAEYLKEEDRPDTEGPGDGKKKTMHAIAIDGPAGAGKSTIAKAAARELGFIYVDTGALYRAIGLSALRHGVGINDREGVSGLLASTEVDLRYVDGEQRVFLNGEDVSGEIRTEEVSMAASAVSAQPDVRAFLLELQRDLARKNNVVMDGRDIGTVVLPDAKCKIFLTASPEVRAMRRYKQLLEKGEEADYEAVLEDLKTRDYNDTHREIAPLKLADDGVEVDTSELDLEESIRAVIDTAKERLGI